MKNAITALILAVVLPVSALAGGCPPAVDHTAAMDRLIARANNAPNARAAQEISGLMWQLWADAPDAQSQALLDRGMSMRSASDFTGARRAFDALVEYCPDYAEGYNQRAFVSYLSHDFPAALIDLDRAIARSPRHVAAIAGRALTLVALDRLAEARLALDRALALNPWLSERRLAEPGGPLAPKGEDI